MTRLLALVAECPADRESSWLPVENTAGRLVHASNLSFSVWKKNQKVTRESAHHSLSRNSTKSKHLWHASAGVTDHLDYGYPNCSFSRVPTGECEGSLDSHLYSEGKTYMIFCLCWFMQPKWVQPKATYLFMSYSRAISWYKTSRSVSCTTTTFSFSRCRRGQFCSNLLVPCLMCDRAAHGIPLRWDQEESCNPFVVFPAFSSRILKTAARNNGNLRAGLASELSFEHFLGRRTSLSNKNRVTYNILPWHC